MRSRSAGSQIGLRFHSICHSRGAMEYILRVLSASTFLSHHQDNHHQLRIINSSPNYFPKPTSSIYALYNLSSHEVLSFESGHDRRRSLVRRCPGTQRIQRTQRTPGPPLRYCLWSIAVLLCQPEQHFLLQHQKQRRQKEECLLS